MLDKQLLKSYIVKFDGTQDVLSKAMDLSLSRLNAKINSNRGEFTYNEICFLKDRYKLSNQELGDIFFN